MTRLRTGLTTLALPLLLLTACGDDETPEATDQASTGTVEGDYADVGLEFIDPPEVKGVYIDALQTYVDFERGRRQAAREGTSNELLTFNATRAVANPVKQAAQGLAEDATYDGTVTVEFTKVQPRDTVFLLDVCVDGTALEVPDGAPVALGEATRAAQRIEVSNLTGPWRVTKVEALGASC